MVNIYNSDITDVNAHFHCFEYVIFKKRFAEMNATSFIMFIKWNRRLLF
jgi:hypothetical protein